MALCVGVDGGGTKTKAVVLDAQKKEIGSATAGSSNHNSVGAEEAKKTLFAVISDAVKASGHSLQDVGAICWGISGCDCTADEILMHGWAAELLPHLDQKNILIFNDSVAALSSGTLGKLHGVVVISGTGMIACGFKDGHSVRAGGWGSLLGDGGSGYAIASAMLKAVVQHHDGTGPATRLTPALLKHLNLHQVSDLIGWTYADHSWARFAALAPIVFDLYESDEVAAKIVNQGVDDLLLCIRAVCNKLGFVRSGADAQPLDGEWSSQAAFDLVLAGGIAQSPLVSSLISQHLARIAPHARVVMQQVAPEVGAALLAVQHLQDSK